MYQATAVIGLLVSALCLCASLFATWCSIGDGFFFFGPQLPYHVQVGIMSVHAQFVGGRQAGHGATGAIAHLMGDGKTAAASKFHGVTSWSDFARKACTWDNTHHGGGFVNTMVSFANEHVNWADRTCDDVTYARFLNGLSAVLICGGVVCCILGTCSVMGRSKGAQLLTFPAAVLGFCALILISQSSVAYMVDDIFGGGWMSIASPGFFFLVMAATAAFFALMLNYQEYDEDFGAPPLYSNVYGAQAQYHYGAAPVYGRGPPPVARYDDYYSDGMDGDKLGGCLCIGLSGVVFVGCIIILISTFSTGPGYGGYYY